MNKIENWGDYLKSLIKESKQNGGPDQNAVAEYVGISSQLFSYKLKDNDIDIKLVLGILECLKIDLISLLYEPNELDGYLPEYVTDDDLTMFKILNKDLPENQRLIIKRIFRDILTASQFPAGPR